MEPPTSLPIPRGDIPEAMAEASPPLDPPGGPAGHPGVFGAAVDHVVGLPPQGEFGHVGLGDEDSASVFQPLHHGGVGRGDVIFEEHGTAGGAHTFRVHAVLHGEWHSVERSPILPAHGGSFGFPGPVHDAIRVGDQRIQTRIDGVDTIKVGLYHLHRRQLPVSDTPGQLMSVGIDNLFVHRGASSGFAKMPWTRARKTRPASDDSAFNILVDGRGRGRRPLVDQAPLPETGQGEGFNQVGGVPGGD